MGELKTTEGGQAIASVAEICELAMRYPRNISEYRAQLTAALEDPDVALEAWYSLPKGGKMIEGPSVRLAELAITTYGRNMIRFTSIEEGEDYVEVRCQAIDLQTVSSVETVGRRTILDSKGKRYQRHLIETTIQAAKAIAYRDAVFKIIPAALIKLAMDHAKKTVDAAIAANPTAVKEYIAAKVVEYGGTIEELCAAYGLKKGANLNGSQLKDMLGLLNALRSGYTIAKFVGGSGGGTRKSLAGSDDLFTFQGASEKGKGK